MLYENNVWEDKMNIAKYIVLTEDKKEVRFFAAGIVNEDDTFTGIMHDYIGSGDYKERLVFMDKWIPEADLNNEPLEWDEEVEIFDTLSPTLTVQDIEDALDEFICYDTDVFNYVPQNGMMRYFVDGVFIDNISLRVPYGLGNISFIYGYAIVESIEYKITSNNDDLQEVELHEERADRTLHGLKNGLAYYNYEGVHFRVFNSFEDGLHWLDNGDDDLVIAEFENEQELDSYLGAKS
jgi:hypothetical protein